MTATAEAAAIFNRTFASNRFSLPAWVTRGAAVLRNLGPYAAIELLLPGGTLVALLLWLYRRYERRSHVLRAMPLTNGRGRVDV